MNAEPRFVDASHVAYSLDRRNPPVLEIDAGEVVAFQTLDARSGTVRSEADLLDKPHPRGPNPATGPVAVRRALPVDSLVVEILDIRLSEQGFLAIKKDVGLTRQHAVRSVTRIVPVRDGRVTFSDRIAFPARPMVGVIGTAPASGGVPTALPGAHGGNMDNRYVRPGAKVHLPVAVPGALLSLGDVHASMGDGEVTMVGLEIGATVTVRVGLDMGVRLARPWIETRTDWITTGDDPDPARALAVAADEMIHLLMRKLHIGAEEAFMLVSARGDVQVCQACDPGSFPVTARCVFPRLENGGAAS